MFLSQIAEYRISEWVWIDRLMHWLIARGTFSSSIFGYPVAINFCYVFCIDSFIDELWTTLPFLLRLPAIVSGSYYYSYAGCLAA